MASASCASPVERHWYVHLFFAYLYLHRTVAVDRIIDEVIVDGNTDNPKGYLHTTIYQLRQSLAAAGLAEHVVIRCDQGSYRLEVQDLASDIEAFELAAARTASDRDLLWEAVELYGGGLLEGVEKLHRYDPGNGSLAFHVARLYQQLGHRGLADDYVERYLLRYREEWGLETERERLVYSG